MSNLTFSNRSIVDFKQKLTGGGARSNLFEVEIEYPTEINVTTGAEGPKEFGKFMIKAAEIPASNLGNIPVPFRGRLHAIAGDRTFDPWTVTIINDTNFRIREAMEVWSNSINDLQTSQGLINPVDYQTSAKVKQLSRQGGVDPGDITVLREYRFEGIYPNVVSEIALDYGATDQIEEFQVTFNYLFYSVTDGVTIGESGSPDGASLI